MGIPVVLAIFVGLACSFIQSLGLTVQRKSHLQDEALPPDERKRAVRRPLWIAGFAVYISSNVFGSVFQIGALPIVVLAPLGGVSLLWNSLLAHVLLGEGFTSAMMMGTVLIATGAVLIAIFGVVPDGNHSLDELLELWVRPAFLVFFAAICFLVLVVLAGAHVAVWRCDAAEGAIALGDEPVSNYASPRAEMAIPFRPSALAQTGANGDDAEIDPLSMPTRDTKLVRFASIVDDDPFALPCDPRITRTRTLAGLAFAAVSGTLSGMCLVLAKSAVELVIATIDYWHTGRGTNEFARVQTWFLAAGLGVAAVLQLVYLNYSLAFASPALVCPLAFCFFNMVSIFDGLVFYNQLGRLATHQVVLVSLGVAILLVGVWIVSAIQPAGDGGVEVGTWVEEEALCDEPLEVHDEAQDELDYADGATLIGGETHDEPDSLPASPAATTSHHPAFPSPPHIDTAAARSGSSSQPASGVPPSPHSPMSPTNVARLARLHRRPRYGTLIPELARGVATPAGFAFGIGAASPGFALRSNSISIPHDAPRRSRSASQGAFSPPLGSVLNPQGRVQRRDTYSGVASTGTPSRGRPVSMPPLPADESVAGPPAPEPEHPPHVGAQQVEDTLAEWAGETQSRWRWPWQRRGGGVKLP